MNVDIDFNKQNGLIPAIIQDVYSRRVLMLGYMNEEALQKTLDEKRVTFYSRSKKRLWTKGESSGNFLEVEDYRIDCDQDTILILARPLGSTCHLNRESCFGEIDTKGMLYKLEHTIASRIKEGDENSYTRTLYHKGINKVAQKVGEEAVELVIESKDNNESLFLNEAADLMYHFLILLQKKGYKMEDVENILTQRAH